MLGTKLRALYQRRKGRDLFDLWHSHTCGVLEPELVVDTFLRYMNEDGEAPRRKVFLENLREKMHSPAFLSDATPLLRPGLRYDPKEAGLLVERLLLSRLSK